MKNKILLSTLLLASLAVSQSAFAAPDSATQECIGQLQGTRSVVAAGSGLQQPIAATSATVATLTAIEPAFTVTDTTKNETLSMIASCTGSLTGANGNAIFGVTGSGGFIAMSTADATTTAFNDVIGGSPNPAVNVDVIAFPISTPVAAFDPSTPSAQLDYTPLGTKGWTGKIIKPGITKTTMSIAGPSVPNTFSYEDSAGDYVSTILLGFNPL